MLFQSYSDFFDKETRFYVHNFIWIIFVDGFLGFFVPLKHLLMSRKSLPSLWVEDTPRQIGQFYTRPLDMIPRRPETHQVVVRKRKEICLPIIDIHSGQGRNKAQFQTRRSRTHKQRYHNPYTNTWSTSNILAGLDPDLRRKQEIIMEPKRIPKNPLHNATTYHRPPPQNTQAIIHI